MYREFHTGMVETLHGRLGDEISYVVHGRQRWRHYVKPSDPRTKRQLCRLRCFARLVFLWHCLDEADKARWNDRAAGKPLTGFNLFMSAGMKEFEAAQRMLEIKTFVRSSRQRVIVKTRSINKSEWHAWLLHAFIISPAFRYRRE